MPSNSRSIDSRTPGTDSVRRMSCMYLATCSLPDRFTSFIKRYVMHIIYCAQVCLCSHVVIDRLFSLSKYTSSLHAPNSAPQSHLRIGLPFGTSIPCPQLEQVMIRLGTFSPTLRAVFFTVSVHKETTKLFPIFLKIVLLFTFLLYHSIFFLFHCVTLHPNHISISDYHSELPFRARSWNR